jgi:hypothetical protein
MAPSSLLPSQTLYLLRIFLVNSSFWMTSTRLSSDHNSSHPNLVPRFTGNECFYCYTIKCVNLLLNILFQVKEICFLVYLFFLYCHDGWGNIVAFTQVITVYQIYCTWIHPLNHSPLSLPPPIPGVSADIIFAFTYTCTHFIALYSPSYSISLELFWSRWCLSFPASHPGKGLLCTPVLWLRAKKRKDKMKKHDILAWDKGSYTGSLLWFFHICMYYNPSWFISSNFLLMVV